MKLQSSIATKQFGKKFAEKVRQGGIICLYGDLGAGKTTFTQGLAEGLGIHARIISPTFVIVRTYKISDKQKAIRNKKADSGQALPGPSARMTGRMFYHIDLYRTNSEQDLIGIGLPEILENKENIVVIEWAEKLGSILPKKRFDIRFAYTEDNIREVVVKELN